MNMTIQPATPAERLYTYTQSQQIIGQTGCIGHLRADIDTDGIAIYSQWDTHYEKLKTDEFKAELSGFLYRQTAENEGGLENDPN